jgi:hypothetical protein
VKRLGLDNCVGFAPELPALSGRPGSVATVSLFPGFHKGRPALLLCLHYCLALLPEFVGPLSGIVRLFRMVTAAALKPFYANAMRSRVVRSRRCEVSYICERAPASFWQMAKMPTGCDLYRHDRECQDNAVRCNDLRVSCAGPLNRAWP